MVELQPSKLVVRVRFPSPAFEGRVERGEPRDSDLSTLSCSAAVAQSVERVLGKDEVKGSSPFSSFLWEYGIRTATHRDLGRKSLKTLDTSGPMTGGSGNRHKTSRPGCLRTAAHSTSCCRVSNLSTLSTRHGRVGPDERTLSI